MTRVVKINPARDNFTLYIGRAVYVDWGTPFNLPASKWANPFRPNRILSRTDVLELYERHIRNTPFLWAALYEIDNQVLGCWCHDSDGSTLWCHGDVLIKLRQEQLGCLRENIKTKPLPLA